MEIDKIKINPNNPRFIKDEKFKSLVKSLIELPVMTELREIVVDEDNVIIGGNMRYRAAKEAGWKEIPTKVFTREMADENNKLTNQNKTYEQYCKEIMIKDNISGGEWDWELLSSQFEKEELEDWGLDVDKWKEDEVVEDEVPEVTENPVSKLGEVYQLGRHRIMCGDSTKIEDVEKLMGGKKADMVFTDPPYSVNYEKKQNEILGNKAYNHIENDDMSVKDISEQIWRPVFKNLYDMANDDCSFYMTMPQGGDQMMMMMMMMSENWQVKHELIWVKPSPVFSMGRLNYDYKHEPIIFGWKKTHNWYGFGKYTKSVWEIARESDKSHPTMKPVELVANAIQNSTKNDDIVIDYFLGSGSTLIACEQTNRICYGMEIDPKYIDVIRKRYAKFINSEDWESATPKIL